MIADWLKGLLTRGFRPNFDPEKLLSSIKERSGEEWDANSKISLAPLEERDALLATWFRNKPRPVFFVSAERVAPLLDTVTRDHRRWKEGAEGLARQSVAEGLMIYGTQGPPLDERFPWGGAVEGPGRDKLYIKRPHRFAVAPALAKSICFGATDTGVVLRIFRSWMGFARSKGSSLAYDSNLAVIQRLLALTWSWLLLSADKSSEPDRIALEAVLLRIICADVTFLLPRLGESYANNHLLADYFAGWWIGSVWPEMTPSDFKDFEEVWLTELRRQTLADGSSFEHSSHYHEFACEMAVTYLIFKQRLGQPIPGWFTERAERLLAFQTHLSGPESQMPRLGDGVEEPFYPLDSGDGWGTAAFRELYRALFNSAAVPAPGSSPEVERAFWLLDGHLQPSPPPRRVSSGVFRFPQGGYYVLEFDSQRVLFRTGPAEGTEVMAGHMHADTLSICFSIAGERLFVDPGTYTYRSRPEGWAPGEPQWRAYFAGPSAHNRVSIGERDPLGTPPGDFRERSTPFRSCTDVDIAGSTLAWVRARHATDEKNDEQSRSVIALAGEYWIIHDVFTGDLSEAAVSSFQLSPGHTVSLDGPSCAMLSMGRVVASMVSSEECDTIRVRVGEVDPISGWVSDRYGERDAAPQIKIPAKRGSSRLSSVIRVGEKESDLGFVRHDLEEELVMFDIRRGRPPGRRISQFKRCSAGIPG